MDVDTAQLQGYTHSQQLSLVKEYLSNSPVCAGERPSAEYLLQTMIDTLDSATYSTLKEHADFLRN